jgi:hypothetical protein
LQNKELRLELKQVQPGNVFLDPVTVTITTAAGKRDLILKPTGKQLIQSVPLREPPLRLDLDPLNILLDESTVKGI